MISRIDNINELLPHIAKKVQAFITEAKKELNVDIFETYRTFARSNELNRKGTGAKGGYSFHNYRRAIDIVFKDHRGKWTWDSKCNWKRLGEIGKKHGFEWGGDGSAVDVRKGDMAHFQIRDNQTILDLFNNYQMKDKFTKWSQDIGLCNDEQWYGNPTKYELIVILNRFAKHILENKNK